MFTRLPAKRTRARMGVKDEVRRSFPVHEAWVRKHACVVPGCPNTDIEFMHLRSAANAGMGLKPSSAYGISGCREHHAEAHRIGHDSFARKYGIDLWALAEQFAKQTTDRALRQFMRERTSG